MTLSIRLGEELEQQLARTAAQSGLSKSAIVKQSLRDYLANMTPKKTAYELGKDLFDKGPGSGEGDLSSKAKIRQRITERIRAENHR